ncbi:exported hypothetical protein [Paraburkholderia tropica]|uniref:TcpQ domain-containing protein n=1 Tax=Paraburkholderia tropica TaxID=92647 RepID=UPI001CB3F3BE|nr:TcpQ domain-containing protein [Paraburkholderia tropica]CAG9230003.1 exported hypothetical protein [Paraburkholderia tropica]
MKKFVVALAMVPAVSQAELIVLDPPNPPGSVAPVAPKAAPIIKVSAAPAPIAAHTATQLLPSQAPAQSGFVDIRSTAPQGTIAPASIQIQPVPPPLPVFVARVGSTARESVESWAASAGWKAAWRAETPDGKLVNYNITEADVRMQGQIVDVVSRFIHLYDSARLPLKVLINPEQKLFVITLKH